VIYVPVPQNGVVVGAVEFVQLHFPDQRKRCSASNDVLVTDQAPSPLSWLWEPKAGEVSVDNPGRLIDE